MSAGILFPFYYFFFIVSCLNIEGRCLFYILKPLHAAAPLSIFTAGIRGGLGEGDTGRKRAPIKIEQYCLGRRWAGRFRLRLA